VSTAKLDRKGRVSGRLDEKREVEAMGRKGSGGAVEEGMASGRVSRGAPGRASGRVSRMVMPQILSKSPNELRNPEMWRDISDEKIFLPMRKVNKQKRPHSILLPKVKIALSA
jgi:hypothetical protein